MANLRSKKKELKALLSNPDWRQALPEIADMGMPATGALFSFLLLAPELAHRAAVALGMTVAKIYERNPEAARNVIRRFMWHMNEDSGNIGWGIPCAFAETLAHSRGLAKEYAHILISYVMDLGSVEYGVADNYCDHAALRRDCFWAVGRLARAWPDLTEKARPWLVRGLSDEDSICRGMAAWALGELGPTLMEAPALNKVALSHDEDECAVFESYHMRRATVSELAKEALEKGPREL